MSGPVDTKSYVIGALSALCVMLVCLNVRWLRSIYDRTEHWGRSINQNVITTFDTCRGSKP